MKIKPERSVRDCTVVDLAHYSTRVLRNFKLNLPVKNIIPVCSLDPRISNLESQHPSFTSVTSDILQPYQ
ncbi:hypothetical protein [Microcoleus sp. S13_C3]|uniref:hypothetical protein n=1 Tax=Microcoleus sp. S13_C3 TaxID=3055409 RepID=UPI002FCFC245